MTLRGGDAGGGAPFAVLAVDHAAIAANVRLLARTAGVPVMAVVKADGFGTGMLEVARTAVRAGAAALGVATVEEALRLRTGGLHVRILAWLCDAGSRLREAVALRVELGCSTPEQLAAVAEAARAAGCAARVHLEVDTGLTRGGASREGRAELFACAARYEGLGLVEAVAVWSHLAHADQPDPGASADAVARLREAVALAREAGLRPGLTHLGSSGAALAHPEARLDLVRCGQALFGIQPVQGVDAALVPAVRLTSRVLLVREVPAGTSVSYGARYTTPAATTLALVPVGYADGIPRGLRDGASVTIGGRRCRVAGRVSMDQLVVDAGQGAAVRAGDEVVVFGDPAAGEPALAEWAAWADTIPQEILTGIGARVQRRHEGGAHVV